MAATKKQSPLRKVRDEMTVMAQRTAIYNNVVEQLLKKINKKYGKLNGNVDDRDFEKEIAENDKRFMDILTSMIALEERMSKGGKRKYSTLYAQYARMVDRTASSMTKKSESYTLNFSLRRGMAQNEIMLKKLVSRMNGMIQTEERK